MIKLPEFDLYLFDLDDTLINTRQAYYDAQKTAVVEVFPQLSGSELEKQLRNLKWLCRLFGSGQPENYFTAFVADLSGTAAVSAASVSRLLEVYNDNFHKNLKPLEGSTAYLQRLADRGKPVAIVSNGKTTTQLHKLQLTGLDGFFSASSCFISEMVSPVRKKPSPHLVEMACSAFRVKPEKAVYFGNMAADVVAGNLAGTTTVLYRQGSETGNEQPAIARPDFHIDDWL